MKTNTQHTNDSGFALLMTIIVVGVVLSVGLTILDLSIKQVRLADSAKESEIAFHAANAGLECARYWRREEASLMEVGQPFNPECFEEGPIAVTPNVNPPDLVPVPGVPSDGAAYLYEYEFTWGAGLDRCTKIATLIVSSDLSGNGFEVSNMEDLFTGYPDGPDYFCEPGAQCSVVSVRGYNKLCNNISQYGTIQREVLLQF
jgi:hypothetical protein